MSNLFAKIKFEIRVLSMRLYNTLAWRTLWLMAGNDKEKQEIYKRDLNGLIENWKVYFAKEVADSPYIVKRAKPVLNDLIKQAERTCGLK